VYEAPYFAYGYPFGYGPYHRHFGGYRPLYTPRDQPPGSALARSAEEAVSEASAAALSEALEASSAVAVVGLAAVAVLVEVQASLKGVSTAAAIAKIHPSFVTKRYRGIHLGGPAGRQVAGQKTDRRQHPAYHDHGKRIPGTHTEKQRGQQTSERQRSGKSDGEPRTGHPDPAAEDKPQHVDTTGA
jgi:hypothetical protein